MRSLAGVPVRATLEILLEKFQVSTRATLDEMYAFKESCTRAHMHGLVKATKLVEVVKKYQGIKPMAIGTGSQTPEARMVLELCGLAHRIDVVVGADQVKNPKPAPDTFLRCAELMGVQPDQCVVFEDSPLGLQAAHRAGMTGVDVLQVHQPYFC
jgi:HAD superfamily hydrolase (TIGR01509 family)